MCQIGVKQDYCSSVLRHMAAVHQCGYEVGLPVQKARHGQGGVEEGGMAREEQLVSSGDIKTRRTKERKLFPFVHDRQS